MKTKNIFTTLMVYKVIVIILVAVLLWFALRPKEAEHVYYPDNTDMVDSLININLKLGEVNENLQKILQPKKSGRLLYASTLSTLEKGKRRLPLM